MKGEGDAAVRIEWETPQSSMAETHWAKIDRAAKKADAVIFVGGIDHSLDTEGRDRLSLTFPQMQETLIKRLASKNKNTHVVLINGSPLEIGGWLPNVCSVVEAWYPGMEGGTAVANVLFGETNPSGRLSFTWPKKLEDSPSHKFGYEDNDCLLYNEGLMVGYRYYDTKFVEPEFAFGFGLSYTTFEYRDFTVEKKGPAIVKGSMNVCNTGKMDGYELVQIYVKPVHPSVERPIHELKWFKKVFVRAGESVLVEFDLQEDAFSYYDVRRAGWVVDLCNYEIELCRDSGTLTDRRMISL